MKHRIFMFLFLLTAFLFSHCNETKKPHEAEEASEFLEAAVAVTKLERIRAWRDSTQIIQLPFRANFDSSASKALRVQLGEIDSIFRDDFRGAGGDVYLMGMVADTTNFYTMVFLAVAAVGKPGIVTFDKEGNGIDIGILTEENCLIYAGDILLCQEYTTIGTDYSLHYYYKSIVADAGGSGDTVCEQASKKGYVSRKGDIELGQLEKINCKE